MFQAGQQIGVYILIELLGRGGFGEVWLAEKRSGVLTKKVAVKLPHEESVNLEAIRQEAALWEQVSKHENVLTIFDADIYDGQIAIISEYAEGGSLADRLKREGKLPVEQAVEMTIGILKGLDHLHSKFIIHRDIKPQNILLQGNTPRLADFGISRAMSTSNISSVIIGTDSYMAPEALDGVRNVQTDIWSVGVVLYQLLKGSLPFPQDHPSERMFAILMKDFPPLPDEIPQNLKAVVGQALTKDPAARFQTAEAMCKALDLILTHLRNPTYAPTERFSIPAESIPELPQTFNDQSVVTKSPFTPPPVYEAPPTQVSPELKPEPPPRIVIERKAVEQRQFADNDAAIPETVPPVSPPVETDSAKSILDLTNENVPKLLQFLLWGLIGGASGVIAAGYFFIAKDFSTFFSSFTGAILAIAVYLFGEYAFPKPLGKRKWVFTVLIAFSTLGFFNAMYYFADPIYRFSGDFTYPYLVFGTVWGFFIVIAELLCWNIKVPKLYYAFCLILFMGLARHVTSSLFLPLLQYYGLAVPLLLSIGIFTIWQTLVLIAHAAAFSKNKRWLISMTAVLAAISALIFIINVPKNQNNATANSNKPANVNKPANANTVSNTNGNLKK